jgi:hypothetical protein
MFSNAFCQSGQISGYIKKSNSLSDMGGLRVFLKYGDSIVTETISDSTGHFKMKNIKDGFYSLVIHQIGYRETITDSLEITKDKILELNITYPPPCKFIYRKGKKPECVGGHTNHIIPIIYGLPSKKILDKSKKGLVHLGGCIISDCDPHYYCTIHKKEL